MTHRPALWRRFLTAILAAGMFASVLATTTVVLRASGEYNSNPPYCHGHDAWDPPFLWFYYECWKPDDPSWGSARLMDIVQRLAA